MKIVQYPHPALRHEAQPLTAIDEQVRTQARRMLDLMYEAHGIGLAGNQVAWPYRLFVLNLKSDPQQRELEHIFINPQIVDRKGSVEAEEGCLSFPGLYQNVRRAKVIQFQAYNLEGKLVEMVSSDLPQEIAELFSRAVQHEVDHLEGVLFIDKMGPLGKLASRSTLRDFEREFRRAQERGDLPSDEEIQRRLREPPPNALM
jgi:peptide deformylase